MSCSLAAHLALGKHMEHFSRAADFLFYFRTKFAELHTEEGKEMDAETAKYLDRLALVLLLHFEQVRRSGRRRGACRLSIDFNLRWGAFGKSKESATLMLQRSFRALR